MKSVFMVAGMAAGAALAVTAVSAMYPDVMRRMKRDGAKTLRSIKRTAGIR